MPILIIEFTLSDEEAALLRQLVVVYNKDVASTYDASVVQAAAAELPFDPGPRPTPEDVTTFATRVGLKTLRGELVRMREALLARNIKTVVSACHNPAILEADKNAALAKLGLVQDGLHIIKKV